MLRRTLIASLAAATAGCAETVGLKTAQPRVAEQRTHERLNDLRADAGQPRVPEATALVEAARAHARDMHERGFYDHVNPDGEAPEDRVSCGAGENIHRGELGPMETADGETWYTRDPGDMAGYLVRDWQLSEPHRRNLLDPQWRQQGVGIVVDGNHFFGVAMFC